MKMSATTHARADGDFHPWVALHPQINFTYRDHLPNSNVTDMDMKLYQDMRHLHLDIGAAFIQGLLTHNTPFTALLIFLYSAAFLVGLIGNALVIAVIVRHSYMRTVTNMFLVNLSVGDLLVVIVCMPFSLAPYVYKVSVLIFK